MRNKVECAAARPIQSIFVASALLASACGTPDEPSLDTLPTGHGQLLTESYGATLKIEVNREVRSFESKAHIAQWLSEHLPADAITKVEDGPGFSIASDQMPDATVVVDGHEFKTTFPIAAMIGGLSGWVEIAGEWCVHIDGECDDDSPRPPAVHPPDRCPHLESAQARSP